MNTIELKLERREQCRRDGDFGGIVGRRTSERSCEDRSPVMTRPTDMYFIMRLAGNQDGTFQARENEGYSPIVDNEKITSQQALDIGHAIDRILDPNQSKACRVSSHVAFAIVGARDRMAQTLDAAEQAFGRKP